MRAKESGSAQERGADARTLKSLYFNLDLREERVGEEGGRVGFEHCGVAGSGAARRGGAWGRRGGGVGEALEVLDALAEHQLLLPAPAPRHIPPSAQTTTTSTPRRRAHTRAAPWSNAWGCRQHAQPRRRAGEGWGEEDLEHQELRAERGFFRIALPCPFPFRSGDSASPSKSTANPARPPPSHSPHRDKPTSETANTTQGSSSNGREREPRAYCCFGGHHG